MKILILSTKMPWPPKDGGAIATLNLAMGLANDVEVTMLTMNTGKHYFPIDEVPPKIREQLNLLAVDVDTRIKPLQLMMNFLFSSYPYIARRFISIPFESELKKCLEESNYDIVQLEGPYLGHYIQLIGSGPSISFRAHNLEHKIWELRAKEERNPVKKIYFRSLSRRIRKLEKTLIGQANFLLPISDADANGFREMNHSLAVHVCPAGLDLEKYKPHVSPSQNSFDSASSITATSDIHPEVPKPQGTQPGVSQPGVTQPGPPRLFYIGALDWAPNQEGLNWFFMHVWPSIIERWPEIVLDIAGRNSEDYLHGDLPPNVIMKGEVEDAMTFYQRGSIMIVPLLSGSGIRIKILEAMALGKVVICSTVAAAGLGTIPGKHLFIADTKEHYLDTIKQLMEEPGKMHEISRNARQFVTEKFDNFILSKKLISFYKAQLT